MWSLSCRAMPVDNNSTVDMSLFADASVLDAPLPHLRLKGLMWGRRSDEPVIALHGWLDNSASFFQLAPLLKGYHVIAPDLVGHGLSDHRPRGVPYYVWDNVTDLLALLDHLSIKRFHLLGHSMGAGIASMLAAIAPDRVISTTLLDGLGPVTTPSSQSPQQMLLSLKQRARIAQRAPRHYAHFEEAVTVRSKSHYPVSLSAARALVSRALSKTAQGWCWHTDPYLFAPSVLRLTEEQVAEFLSLVECPVLLCIAEQGIAAEPIYRLAKRVKQLELVKLPGGHHFHLEEGCVEMIAETILAHLHHNSHNCPQNHNSRIKRV